MSEINEGNCVLDENELILVQKGLLFYSTFLKMEDKSYKKYSGQLFLKITKLNDLAKEAKNVSKK